MKQTPTLLYVLEQEIGLDPELSHCNACAHVEYIYFTGIVCHVDRPQVGEGGRCLDVMPEKQAQKKL